MSGGNFKLGLFVTVAVVLLVGFLLTLGALDRFKPHVNAETYFLESIQTLKPGAAVRFRGVSIGIVDWVGFVVTHYPEATEQPGIFRSYIMVSMKLDSATLAQAGVGDARADRDDRQGWSAGPTLEPGARRPDVRGDRLYGSRRIPAAGRRLDPEEYLHPVCPQHRPLDRRRARVDPAAA